MFVRILIGLALGCLLTALLAPTLLSTDWGRGRLVQTLNQKIPGTVSLEDLNLSWLGTQRIEGLVVRDPKGEQVLNFKAFEAQVPIWKLMWRGIQLGEAELNDLNAHLVEYAPGLTNLHLSLSETRGVTGKEVSPIYLTLSGVNIQKKGAEGLHIWGKTAYEKTDGAFDIKVTEGKKRQVQAHVQNFPLAIVDGWLSLRKGEHLPEVQTLLGPTLNLSTKQTYQGDQVLLTVDATSEKMHAQLEGSIENHLFALNKPAQVTVQLTPALFQSLKQPTSVTLALQTLEFPLARWKSRAKELAIDAEVTTPHAELDIYGVTLRNARGTLQSADGEITFELKSRISRLGRQGELHAITHWPIETPLLEVPEAAKPLKIVFESQGIERLEGNLSITKLNRHGAKGHLRLERLTFANHPVSLIDVEVPWEVYPSAGTAAIAFNGNTLVAPQNKRGRLHGNFSLSDWNKTQMDPSEIHIEGELIADSLPAAMFCRVFCPELSLHSSFEAVLGKFLNVNLKINLSKFTGPINAQLAGEKGTVDLAGQATGGVLTLKKPFRAQVKATPILGRDVLSEILPLLSSIENANHPLTVTIDPEGFSLPLVNPTMSALNFKYGMLEMGKVLFRNEGELRKLLKLLKAPKHPTLTIWFTPLYFGVKKGVLKLQRGDFLIAQDYPMAVWGKVDFVKDKVNMVVGLTPRAISNAFQIGGVRDDVMLQVPLKGSSSNPKIDASKATAQIAALIAQSQSGKGTGLVGTMIDIASDFMKPSPAPPPTTNPLPWKTH